VRETPDIRLWGNISEVFIIGDEVFIADTRPSASGISSFSRTAEGIAYHWNMPSVPYTSDGRTYIFRNIFGEQILFNKLDSLYEYNNDRTYLFPVKYENKDTSRILPLWNLLYREYRDKE
jgi:hypothetical protein